MSENIYYKEEAIPLVFRMALSYREEKGTPEEIFERHKKLVYDLLKDKRKDPPGQGWDDKTVDQFCKDLSRHGKVFLKALADAGRALKASEIRKAFEEAGLKWTSNRMINGILAGFTRRSAARHVPSVWDWDESGYTLDKEAARFIKKYL